MHRPQRMVPTQDAAAIRALARVRERMCWLASATSTAIGELFNSIEGWLKPAVDEGIVELERDPYVHPDEQLGTLSEESVKLIVGVSEVFFAPRTGTIAGASARVDMTCGDRTLPIVLLPDRGWHFLVRGPITRSEPVTEDSFADALREMLDG